MTTRSVRPAAPVPDEPAVPREDQPTGQNDDQAETSYQPTLPRQDWASRPALPLAAAQDRPDDYRTLERYQRELRPIRSADT